MVPATTYSAANFISAAQLKSVYMNAPIRLTWTSDASLASGSFPEQMAVVLESSASSWSISQYQATCGSLGAERAGQAFSVVLTPVQIDTLIAAGESINLLLAPVGPAPSVTDLNYNVSVESL